MPWGPALPLAGVHRRRQTAAEGSIDVRRLCPARRAPCCRRFSAALESPGISVFPANHEVLSADDEWRPVDHITLDRLFLMSRKFLEKMLPIYLLDWVFNWITEIRLDDWKVD